MIDVISEHGFVPGVFDVGQSFGNFDTPKHFGQFWFRLLFIVIRNPLASGIVDPIGSLIGIWFDILRYVLPSNACLLEFVVAIGFEMLACKVYKRGKEKNVFLQFLYPLRGFSVYSCIFNLFFQDFYPSPFCIIFWSFLHHFLWLLLSHFPALSLSFSTMFSCLLHRHSLFLAVTPVSSIFQQILHGLFLAFSSDRYHVLLKFHCIFQYILFIGFQYVLSSIFLLHVLSFSPLPSIGFCTISSGFLHFHTFSILILIQEFYLPPSFSDPFCTISSRCYHIFLHFYSIFPACLLVCAEHSLRFPPFSKGFSMVCYGLFLAFAPFSSVFQGILYDFLWWLSCFPAVSLYFPIHPHGLSGHQKGGPRGNRYPTVSKLPSGT